MSLSTCGQGMLGRRVLVAVIALVWSVAGLSVCSAFLVLGKCAEAAPGEGNLRSREAKQGTEILFQNRLTEAIRIYWIDYKGKEVLYAELGSGRSYRQPTYVTHPWLIRSARDGRVIKTIVADGQITAVSAEPNTLSSGPKASGQGSSFAMPMIGVLAAAAWLGVLVVLRAKGMSLVLAAYLSSLMSFWIVLFYLSYQHGNDGAAMDALFKPVIAAVWSPTSDPVLNFLINACVIVVGAILGIGMLASGLFLMVVLLVLLIPVLIASTSVTGAVLVAAAAIAAGVFFLRSRRWHGAPGGSVGGSDYSDFHGDVQPQRPRGPRVWPIGSWSETREVLFGGQYRQHYDSNYKKAGRSEKRSWFGGSYAQHYDSNYKKAGRSEKRSWFGGSYTQHYDSNYNKAGHSEERESLTRGKYVQHYDAGNNKSGHTEKRSGWGGEYEVHYDKDGKRID